VWVLFLHAATGGIRLWIRRAAAFQFPRPEAALEIHSGLEKTLKTAASAAILRPVVLFYRHHGLENNLNLVTGGLYAQTSVHRAAAAVNVWMVDTRIYT
jgi:hypothetical protein